MVLPDAALAHDAHQRRIARATLAQVRRSWLMLAPGDVAAQWPRVAPRLVVQVSAGRLAAARDGADYVPGVLAELGVDAEAVAEPVPQALASLASDGRSLGGLLEQAMLTAREAGGTSAGLSLGLQQLRLMVATQLADAARDGAGLATVARPRVGGYVRMLTLPSCARCAILAGRWYRWSAGFRRHPRCDCRHIPAPESLAGDLTVDARRAIEAGQVTGLSVAARKAIGDGADPVQVVNAYRGMQIGGRVTTAGAARGRVRLMPAEIYRQARGERTEAIRLLRLHGFLR